MPLIAGAVIGGLGAIQKGITGISQLNKAKQLEKNNPRPVFEIQKEYFNNQGLAESGAQYGLTEKALDYYTEEADRGFTSGADTALQLGGGANSISSLYDTYQRGIGGIAVKDAEHQTANIRYLMGVNKDLAAQKTQAWVLNKYEPFKDRAKGAAQERSAGQQNVAGAISDATGVAAGYATGKMNEDLNKIPKYPLNTDAADALARQSPAYRAVAADAAEQAKGTAASNYTYTDKTGNHNNISLSSLYADLYGNLDEMPANYSTEYTPTGAWDYE